MGTAKASVTPRRSSVAFVLTLGVLISLSSVLGHAVEPVAKEAEIFYFLDDVRVVYADTEYLVPAGSTIDSADNRFFIDTRDDDKPLRVVNGQLELAIATQAWTGWIPASSVLVNGVVHNGRYYGQQLSARASADDHLNRYGIDFIETAKVAYAVDLSRDVVLETRTLPDPSAYLDFERSADRRSLLLVHSFDEFHTAPIGYEGVYRFESGSISLQEPSFHYWRDIGAQDMPYASLDTIVEDDTSICLTYEYYESIGVPGYGHGRINVCYEKRGVDYALGEITFSVTIEPRLYDDRWPFRKHRISQNPTVYMGDGWYPLGDGYANSVLPLSRRFLYLTTTEPFLWNVAESFTKRATSTVDRLRIRKQPHLDGEVMGHLSEGDRVSVTDRSGTREEIAGYDGYWYRVVPQAGASGWAYGPLLESD